MNTYLGVYLVRLETPWVRSLKEKRALIRPVMERIKSRFPVSAARLDGLNVHSWEQVGFSVIGSDPAWVNGILDKVESFLAAAGDYQIITLAREVFTYEGEV